MILFRPLFIDLGSGFLYTQNMNKSSGFLSVPVAVLLAGAMIAVAVIYAVGRQSVTPPVADAPSGGSGLDATRAVGADDYIFGDPKSPVTIIEYSDPECPFCKRFHQTLQQIASEYQGKVAWVHRFFPLDSLHSKARKESEAIACAGLVGGNDKFWAYLNRLMDITPSNNQLDLAELPKIAKYIGLDVVAFDGCLSDEKTKARVEADYQNAVAAGGEGTPYSIIIGRDGKKYPVSGALPYAAVREMIEVALK